MPQNCGLAILLRIWPGSTPERCKRATRDLTLKTYVSRACQFFQRGFRSDNFVGRFCRSIFAVGRHWSAALCDFPTLDSLRDHRIFESECGVRSSVSHVPLNELFSIAILVSSTASSRRELCSGNILLQSSP